MNTVIESRKIIRDILDSKDDRIMIIAGPCSIHNPISGIEYARKLKKLSGEVSDVVYLIMRTYLEKPRTITGWKGMLYDPDLNKSMNMAKGITVGRKFLLDVCEEGIPCANEFVNTYFPQYTSDLISWCAIGARNIEYQGSKELASGLSMPIGFKNSTSGDIELAINACRSAKLDQIFPGLNKEGKISVVETLGTKYGHVVLRGGNGQPNYHPEKVDETIKMMINVGLTPNVIVDCSHANSNKQYEKQEKVAYEVLDQITRGKPEIKGIMLESNLYEGSQNFPTNPGEIENLKYGVSITDSCIDWETTERIIRKYAESIRQMKK
jgi:3-deoxy-7-phosphoheptulonate synthase